MSTKDCSTDKPFLAKLMTEEELATLKPTQKMEKINKMTLDKGTEETHDAQIWRSEGDIPDPDSQNEKVDLRGDHSRQVKGNLEKTQNAIMGQKVFDSRFNITDEVHFTKYANTVEKLNNMSEEALQQRENNKLSRQAIIAGKIMRIRQELKALEQQISSDQQSSQDNVQLDGLKAQLHRIYKLQGFKDILKRDDLVEIRNKDSVPQANIEFQQMIEQIQYARPEQTAEAAQKVDLVINSRSKKDLGLLMKLNSLQKRVAFIKHCLGDWKPTPKYKNLTEQVVQVGKYLDLLDSQKISYYKDRIEVVMGELQMLYGPDKSQAVEDRVEQYGHPKDFMEKLYTRCTELKLTDESIPKLVERMEQKKKQHEMCARVMLDVKLLEQKQKLIMEKFAENKELLEEVSEGMTDNLKIAKANLELLKK